LSNDAASKIAQSSNELMQVYLKSLNGKCGDSICQINVEDCNSCQQDCGVCNTTILIDTSGSFSFFLLFIHLL